MICLPGPERPRKPRAGDESAIQVSQGLSGQAGEVGARPTASYPRAHQSRYAVVASISELTSTSIMKSSSGPSRSQKCTRCQATRGAAYLWHCHSGGPSRFATSLCHVCPRGPYWAAPAICSASEVSVATTSEYVARARRPGPLLSSSTDGAAAQLGVALGVCQGDESAGRPEMVPGVVLMVAWVPGIPPWRFNNSTERNCYVGIGCAVITPGPARKGGAAYPRIGSERDRATSREPPDPPFCSMFPTQSIP